MRNLTQSLSNDLRRSPLRSTSCQSWQVAISTFASPGVHIDFLERAEATLPTRPSPPPLSSTRSQRGQPPTPLGDPPLPSAPTSFQSVLPYLRNYHPP